MGIAVDKTRIQPHPLQQLLHPRLQGFSFGDPKDDQRLPHNRPDRLAGIEGGIGILKDHLHLLPHLAQSSAIELSQVGVLVPDASSRRLL